MDTSSAPNAPINLALIVSPTTGSVTAIEEYPDGVVGMTNIGGKW